MLTLTNVSKITLLPQFGWVDDLPDTRSKDLSLAKDSKLLSLGGTIRDEMDLSDFYRPISDQMQFPSCTANAAADAAESQIITLKVDQGVPLDKAVNTTPDLSRMFLWFNGRQLMDPSRGYDSSSGCHNRLILDGMLRHGVCTEVRWPYITANAAKRPSIMSYREAFAHTYAGFYAIKEEGEERKQLILQALAARHSIIFGTDLEQTFMSYRAGVIHKPQAKIIGRHAMVIVGWSAAKQAFKVRNSWSTYWGEKGHCWMHTDYILGYSGTRALWVLTKGALA